jgi:glutamyl-Q tRNA(Asp) synthetase
LVRLEDIDFTRCRPEYEQALLEDLSWLGLTWEKPVWKQSERGSAYQQALQRLSALGVLYPCFCTRRDLADLAAPQGPEGPLYPGICRNLSEGEKAQKMASGAGWALRLDVAKALLLVGELSWEDRRAGPQLAKPDVLGDVVLSRKDIGTSYHLAVTVDDAAQGITLVTRGEDLFAATHVHRLLQALLGFPVPTWEHHALMCDAAGRRLAKRDAARTLQSLREEGISPEEILARLPDYL